MTILPTAEPHYVNISEEVLEIENTSFYTR